MVSLVTFSTQLSVLFEENSEDIGWSFALSLNSVSTGAELIFVVLSWPDGVDIDPFFAAWGNAGLDAFRLEFLLAILSFF